MCTPKGAFYFDAPINVPGCFQKLVSFKCTASSGRSLYFVSSESQWPAFYNKYHIVFLVLKMLKQKDTFCSKNYADLKCVILIWSLIYPVYKIKSRKFLCLCDRIRIRFYSIELCSNWNVRKRTWNRNFPLIWYREKFFEWTYKR